MYCPVLAGALKPINVPLHALDVDTLVPAEDEVLRTEVLTGLLKVEAAITAPPVEFLFQAEITTLHIATVA